MTRPANRQAFVTGGAVLLACMSALYAGTGSPWWAGISCAMVASADRRSFVSKATLRVIGTVCGCLLGFAAAGMTVNHPLTMVVLIAAVMALAVQRRFTSPSGYAWGLGGVTAIMALIQGMQTPDALFPFVLLRAIEISLGVVAYMVVSLIADGSPAARDEPRLPVAVADEVAVAAGQAGRTAGLTALLIMFLWSSFAVPSVLQAVVSVFACMSLDVGSTSSKAGQRLLGCVLGALAGLIAVVLAGSSLFLWSLFLVAGIAVFARIHHGPADGAYVGTQGCVAFLIAFVTGDGPPETIVPILQRIIGILCGVLILIACIRIMRPAAQLRP